MNECSSTQFVLPDFTRLAWVSERAREVWQPRIVDIGGAWSRIEWLSLVEGVRACSLTRMNPIDLPGQVAPLTHYGLGAVPLGLEGQSNRSYSSTPSTYRQGHPFVYPVVIGRVKDTVNFIDAWAEGDHAAIGALLGFPECCTRFFLRHWIEERRVDTTWPMAAGTSSGIHSATEHHIELETSPCYPNVLCRWLGVRLVPHLPCAFDCEPSVTFGKRLAEVGKEHGFERQVEWMTEVLSWPLEWSALHGIAEVRLPVVKVSTRTDATSEILTVRLRSDRIPTEAESGLRFPYKNTRARPLSSTIAFQRGLRERPSVAASLPAETYFRDNGFSSMRAMEVAHAPIISAARAALKGKRGSLLDLGCGNAALLEQICAGEALVPSGIDLNAAAIERARERLDAGPERFVAISLFDVELWPPCEHYEAILLMVGRLLEVSQQQADRLVEHLRKRTNLLILYKYAGYHPDPMETLLDRLTLESSSEVQCIHEPNAVEVALVPLA